MVASPHQILTKWLVRYQLDRDIDEADAGRIRRHVATMTDDQRWQLVDWLRRRRTPHIENAWRESDQVAHRFVAFRSHLRQQVASSVVTHAHRQDALV